MKPKAVCVCVSHSHSGFVTRFLLLDVAKGLRAVLAGAEMLECRFSGQKPWRE